MKKAEIISRLQRLLIIANASPDIIPGLATTGEMCRAQAFKLAVIECLEEMLG